MLNRKITALLLTAALALSLCGAAFAVESGADADQASVSQDIPGEEPAPAESGGETAGPAGQSAQEPPAQEGGEEQPAEQPAGPDLPVPDPAGTVSFANLDGWVRSGCLNYLFLQENVAAIEVIDYEKMQEDLRNGLNDIADAQWQLDSLGDMFDIPPALEWIPGMDKVEGALQGIVSMSTAPTRQALDAQYKALREKFDDLKEGKLQADMADRVRQLQDAQNSIVMLTEGMYIQLDSLNAADGALDRALAALDRQIQELELRYQFGQISALTLQQAKAGRASLVSQQQSLRSGAASLNMSLESMLGAALTGKTKLTALPQVSADQLAAMDLESDLAAAKGASFALYDAKKALDTAEQDFKDADKEYSSKDYQFIQAQHVWQGAQYTYQGAVQSFELKFRTLYAQVKDYAQILEAAKTALAVEEDNCSVSQLKYGQGTISKNALLTAQESVGTARDKVASAQRDLFSAYNNYRWAVDHGILN